MEGKGNPYNDNYQAAEEGNSYVNSFHIFYPVAPLDRNVFFFIEQTHLPAKWKYSVYQESRDIFCGKKA